MRLLPDCDTENLAFEFTAGKNLKYKITIIESAPYTSTLGIEQITTAMASYLKPAMTIRLYHDARLAEVTSSQNASALAPSYEYPNDKMRLRNEKHMVNLFLAEWLTFCLNHAAPSIASV
jgi:uncharacterized protein YqiB (DUF1249 family)